MPEEYSQHVNAYSKSIIKHQVNVLSILLASFWCYKKLLLIDLLLLFLTLNIISLLGYYFLKFFMLLANVKRQYPGDAS